MRAFCAWCQRDGGPSFLGEREPFDDASETHGVCRRHLQYLLAALGSTDPGDELKSNEVAGLPSKYVSASVQQVLSNRPVVHPPLPDAVDATGRASPASVLRPTVASTEPDVASTSTAVTPARVRARAAALRHVTRHGSLPTVSALAAAAGVSRGTAATVLKSLRGQPLPPS